MSDIWNAVATVSAVVFVLLVLAMIAANGAIWLAARRTREVEFRLAQIEEDQPALGRDAEIIAGQVAELQQVFGSLKIEVPRLDARLEELRSLRDQPGSDARAAEIEDEVAKIKSEVKAVRDRLTEASQRLGELLAEGEQLDARNRRIGEDLQQVRSLRRGAIRLFRFAELVGNVDPRRLWSGRGMG